MKKVILKSMLLFVAILFVGIAQAQTVTGTVTEENGPLPGANVIVKGTSNGATTDFDGNYSLNDVPSDATLVFSYVGYTTQEIAVGGRSTINTALASDNALDEIVLIGYGSTTIKDATGSVSSVTSEDFNQGVIQSPEQLIQGKTSGVQVSETSGEPGGAINIRIRGSNSVRSNNNPLFVIDGVPLTSGGAPASSDVGLGGGGNPRNPLSFINPNDIESISILKDASATAIYGSRGANGVVIIQTKTGRGASKGVWELSSSISGSVAANEYDLLNRADYISAIESIGNTAEIFSGADTDFQDFYTRTAFSRRSNLSYSKGYTGGNVRASIGYSNTFGVVEDTDQEAITGRLNAQHRFFDDKLTVAFQGTISRVNDQTAPFAGASGSRGDIIGSAISGNPTVPLDPNFGLDDRLNPVNLLNSFSSLSNSTRYLANISADYKFTDEFSAKVTVGYDESEAETTTVLSPEVLGINGTSGIGRGSYNTFDQRNILLEATLNYKKEFKNSKLDVLGGFSYQEFQRSGINAAGAGFGPDIDGAASNLEDTYNRVSGLIDGSFQSFGYDEGETFVTRLFPTVSNTDVINGTFDRDITAFFADTFDNTDELQSFFVRGNYTISDKYLFTATVRADGSSTFGENNQYGIFPSAAFAWQLAEEDFVSDAFSTLKLRLGVGVVGSQEGLGFGQFIRRSRFAGGALSGDNAQVNIPGTTIIGNGNPDLQWEETTDFNVGVDFGFNDDKLSGSINLYRKETNDLLLNSQIAAPSESTVPFIFSNLEDGTVVNQGIEVSINYDWIDTKDWGFSTSLNVAVNDNTVEDTDRVIDLAPINGNGLTGAFAQRLEAGQPLFAFFLAEFLGFDDQGNPLYTDFNGDGVGDPDSDRRFTGDSGVAEVTSGLSFNARYKRFSLATSLNGQFGFSVYNNTANALFTAGSLNLGGNVTSDIVSNGVLTNGENPAASTAVSDRFLEDGDFVRLQSATISYDWPLSGEGFFDSLVLSATGQNLFLITGYDGLDPEVSSNTGNLNAAALPSAGIDYLSIPRARTVTLGVNARF